MKGVYLYMIFSSPSSICFSVAKSLKGSLDPWKQRQPRRPQRSQWPYVLYRVVVPETIVKAIMVGRETRSPVAKSGSTGEEFATHRAEIQ